MIGWIYTLVLCANMFKDPPRDSVICVWAFLKLLIDESVRLCVLTDIDKRGFDQHHALSHNLFSWEFVIGRQSLRIENESGERKRAKEQMAVMKWYYWKKKCGRIRHLI